jgi:hypothetical protein
MNDTQANVRVLTENLYKAVKAVKRTELSSLPALNHAWLRTENGNLAISTHDLETPITAHCAARVNENFSTCVLMVHKMEVVTGYVYGGGEIVGKRKLYPLLDYLKVMAEQEPVLDLFFDPSLQLLTIKAGTSTTVFRCLDAQEFPPVS